MYSKSSSRTLTLPNVSRNMYKIRLKLGKMEVPFAKSINSEIYPLRVMKKEETRLRTWAKPPHLKVRLNAIRD